MFYGLNNLDEKVSRHVTLQNGFFFEAGANDGVSQNNTLYFEQNCGWRGILVEPIPQRFFDCCVNRPKAYVEWGALVPANWDKPWVELTYCNLMTVTKGSWDTREQEMQHVQVGTQFIRGQQVYEFRARPLTISQVLDKYRVTHVDLMSIDLEGFEFQALHGLDFARHRPAWLLVEERQPDRLIQFLAPHYELVDKLSDLDLLFRARAPS
jgi:FkbM family methyltransferase